MILRTGGIVAALVAAAAVALGAAPASAAPPSVPLPECATPIAPDALSVGQPLVGFTVRRGETVEEFDAEVLGVLRNGAGAGRDLVVIEADGPVIDEGGIAAGMSGSPVYTHDGDLIGAIGYSFGFGKTRIAGVTPAPQMLGLLAEASSTAVEGPETIQLEGAVRERAREAGAGPAALNAGTRLPLPLAVSGLHPARVAMLREAAERQRLPFVITGGGGGIVPSSLDPTATLAPGDSFAATLAYGDADFSAIGTTTYACDGAAVALGHPFLFGGPSLLGAGRANVLGIIDDAFAPYKLASPTEPVGILDRDRLAGVRTLLGEQIPTIPVTQDTTALDTGAERLGARTEIVQATGTARWFLPDIAIAHAFANIDSTFDQMGPGSSLVSWTARGTRKASGRPWQVRRTNRFASSFDISFMSVIELWDDLVTLLAQRRAAIDFGGIDLDVEVTGEPRRYRIGAVRWATPGKRFRTTRALRVAPGSPIRARVALRDPESGAARTVPMRFRAPKRPGTGSIRISGGSFWWDDDFFFFDDDDELGFFRCVADRGCVDPVPKARGLDQLLNRIRARPRNDELVGRASFRGGQRTVKRRVDRVVSGFAGLRVRVRPRR